MSDGTGPRFDAAALHEALDAQRRAEGLSWAEVARRLGVAASTLRRTAEGGRVEADGMLAMARWLGRAPESFASPAAPASWPIPPGTARASGRMLRCDTAALHDALDAARRAEGLAWADVARQVSELASDAVTVASLRRLAKGGRTFADVLLATTRWLDRPVVDFTHLTRWGQN